MRTPVSFERMLTWSHLKFTSLLFSVGIGTALLVVVFLLPLRNAVQIGADEGYEVAKATLAMKGYKMYSDVWNDQPPLHTFLVAGILKHVSPSILGPRLLTLGFSMLLLVSFYHIARRYFGTRVAMVATIILMAAPIYLELSVSCMVEIPAMAPALAAIWVLTRGGLATVGPPKERHFPAFGRYIWSAVLAGVLFGAALQIKFINLVLAPLIVFVAWLEVGRSVRLAFLALGAMALAAGIAFIGINEIADGQGLAMQFRQSWEAHFASAKSFEYGSPDNHPFDWSIMARHWDATIPAMLGIVICLRSAMRRCRSSASSIAGTAANAASGYWMIPVIWLGVNLAVFATHRPWWSCYYLHIAVPLSLCAAIGVVAAWERVKEYKSRAMVVAFALYVLCQSGWMVGRLYLESASIRDCPRIESSLFLEDIARYKPYAKFFYTEEPVYSFHAEIPMPPKLAVVALKRLWSGDMTNEKIRQEMWRIKPEIILLLNDNREVPFTDLITAEYQPVYEDQKHRLYVSRATVAKARQ